MHLHTQRQVPGVTSAGVMAGWKGSTAHATNSSGRDPCWACTDLLQLLLLQRVSNASQLLLQIHVLFSHFFSVKGIKRWLDPRSWLEPLGKKEQAGELLLCGVVCAHTAASDMHRGEAIPSRLHRPAVVIFHIITGMQIKMSLFTYNCAVTDLKAELLPFKSHLAQSFTIKIVIKVTSPGTSYLCAFFLCAYGYVHKNTHKTADNQTFQILINSVNLFLAEQEQEGISDSIWHTWAKSNPLLQLPTAEHGLMADLFPHLSGQLVTVLPPHGPTASWVWVHSAELGCVHLNGNHSSNRLADLSFLSWVPAC